MNSEKKYFIRIPCMATFLFLAFIFIGSTSALALEVSFDNSVQGFRYADNTFRGTANSGYASGAYLATGGYIGGGLVVTLGGVDSTNITTGMSGGWSEDFQVAVTGPVTISLRYRLVHAGDFEPDECGQAMVAVNGHPFGLGVDDVLQIYCGGGDGSSAQDSGWQQVSLTIDLSQGRHTITVGGYLNRKTFTNEITEIYFDDLLVSENTIGVETDCTNGFDDDGDGRIDCDDSDCEDLAMCVVPDLEIDCGNGMDDDEDGRIDCDDSDCNADSLCIGSTALLSASFNGTSQGFLYRDDTFRGTAMPKYATGHQTNSALQVVLGGVDNANIYGGISGGWSYSFYLPDSGAVTIELRYRLVVAGVFDSDECGQVLMSVDGEFIGAGSGDVILASCGPAIGNADMDSGWQNFSVTKRLSKDDHTITIGGYLNQKTFNEEVVDIYLDHLSISMVDQSAESNCGNGIDDDGDGLADCNDSDCDADPLCSMPLFEMDCTNGVDDDGDGRIDCLDSDCENSAMCVIPDTEVDCGNGMDDDGDGRIDCDDSDCDADSLCSGSTTLLSASFDGTSQGFSYTDDTFRGTVMPKYAAGHQSGNALQVVLGGVDNTNIYSGMSGGWSSGFHVPKSGSVTIELRYRLVHSSTFESDECGQAILAVDGNLLGIGSDEFLLEYCGTGPVGGQDSGWQFVRRNIDLSAGEHTIAVGGYLNQKTYSNEEIRLYFDDIVIVGGGTSSFFSDSFDGGTSDGWTVVNDSGKTSTWMVSDGKFNQSVNRVDKWQHSYHRGAYAFLNRSDILNLSDYHVSVKARSLSDISGVRDSIGLMLRYRDRSNYVRVSISNMQGFIRLEKRVEGVFYTLASSGRPPYLGGEADIEADVVYDTVFVTINGDPLFSSSDEDLRPGNPLGRGSIALYTQSWVTFDDVRIEPVASSPKLIISNPMAFSVATMDEESSPHQLAVSALATHVPADGGVRFILEGKTPCYDFIPPYDTEQCMASSGFSDVSPGEHSVQAQMIDSLGQPVYGALDINEDIGIAGLNVVLLGDSIINGVGDNNDNLNLGTQNDSANGKNLNRGMAPILNDLLSEHTNGSVTVNNEGLGGTSSQSGLQRLTSTLQRHDSAVWLILFGTNDSYATIQRPAGEQCTESDFRNNEPSCIGTYKYYMRRIVLKLKRNYKIPVLALVPYVRNAPSAQLDLVKKYNLVIRQLTEEHNLLSQPPDFFQLLKDNQSRYFFDNYHPNGVGYGAMAKLWFCEMIPDLVDGTKPAFCSNF